MARRVRDGVVQLIGRMNMRLQIALRGIFSRTFHKERPWVVTPERLETDPAFDPMAITQYSHVWCPWNGVPGTAIAPIGAKEGGA